MTNDQLAAARAAYAPYRPTQRLDKSTEGDVTKLTPILNADPSQMGTTVTVTQGSSAAQIASDLGKSCAMLQRSAG